MKKPVSSEELLEEWAREDEEVRRIRREGADWGFIEKQEPKVREALIYLIERGDRYVAAKIACLTVDEFDEIKIRAKIPMVL